MHRSRVDAFRHRAAAIMSHPPQGATFTLVNPTAVGASVCDRSRV